MTGREMIEQLAARVAELESVLYEEKRWVGVSPDDSNTLAANCIETHHVLRACKKLLYRREMWVDSNCGWPIYPISKHDSAHLVANALINIIGVGDKDHAFEYATNECEALMMIISADGRGVATHAVPEGWETGITLDAAYVDPGDIF